MVKIITFGKCDKNIVIPILSGFFNFILKIILHFSNSKLSEYPLISSMAASLGMSLSFILLIIYKIKNKNEENNDKVNTCQIKLIKDKIKAEELQEKERKILKIKYYFINAFLDFIATILLFAFCLEVQISMYIFDLLIICLVSHFIFKIKIYRHHYFSVVLIIITGIILDIIAGHFNNISENFINIIIKFILEIIIVCYAMFVKFTMDKTFCSAYELCFWTGFINFFFLIIAFFISKEIKFVEDYKIFDHFNEFEIKDLFIFIIIMICKLLYNLFARISLKNSNISYWMIIAIVNELGPYVVNLIDPDSESSIMIQIIIIFGLLLMFFITFIFNEFIEINCLGLERNTKKNINERAQLEQVNIDENKKYSFNVDDYSINLELSEKDKESSN